MDVNLAVNNLLSRDDEEGDDADDTADSYVPEDLISLLDGGFSNEHSVIIDADSMFSEDMFGYAGMRKLVDTFSITTHHHLQPFDPSPYTNLISEIFQIINPKTSRFNFIDYLPTSSTGVLAASVF